MKIRSVYMENFRGKKKFTVVIPTDKPLLIKGMNGSGKSTVFYAIAFALGGVKRDFIHRTYQPEFEYDWLVFDGKDVASVILTIEDDDGILVEMCRKLELIKKPVKFNSEGLPQVRKFHYYIDDVKTDRNMYMKKLESWKLNVNKNIPVAFSHHFNEFPSSPEELATWIERFSGSDKYAYEMEFFQKEQVEVGQKINSYLELEKRLFQEKAAHRIYYILKIFENKKSMESVENRDPFTPKSHKRRKTEANVDADKCRNRLHKFLLLAKVNQIELPLTQGSLDDIRQRPGEKITDALDNCNFSEDELKSSSGIELDFEEVFSMLGKKPTKEKLKAEQKKILNKIQELSTDELESESDPSLLVEREMALKGLIRAAKQEFAQDAESLRDLTTKRRDAFYKLYTPISQSVDGFHRRFNTKQPVGLEIHVQNPDAPWEGVICEHITTDHHPELARFSGGQMSMAVGAVVLALVTALDCPIIMMDDLDDALYHSSARQAVKCFFKEREQIGQVILMARTKPAMNTFYRLGGVELDMDLYDYED